MQKNPVVFWELASHDAEKSIRFLKDLFDWEVAYNEHVGLYEIPAGEGSVGCDGGVFTLRKAKLPFLTIYVLVEDIEAKARRVEELGGLIVEPPQEIPGGAKICLFNEPSGVTLAMYQPKARAQ